MRCTITVIVIIISLSVCDGFELKFKNTSKRGKVGTGADTVYYLPIPVDDWDKQIDAETDNILSGGSGGKNSGKEFRCRYSYALDEAEIDQKYTMRLPNAPFEKQIQCIGPESREFCQEIVIELDGKSNDQVVGTLIIQDCTTQCQKEQFEAPGADVSRYYPLLRNLGYPNGTEAKPALTCCKGERCNSVHSTQIILTSVLLIISCILKF